jgi:hypothetical protein
MRIFPVVIAALALNAVAASDAFAQRGLLKGGLNPPVYDANGRIVCCGPHPAAAANTCTGYYEACMRGYTQRGYAVRGQHDCGAARAVCLRTGVWDTLAYGRLGRRVASVQQH